MDNKHPYDHPEMASFYEGLNASEIAQVDKISTRLSERIANRVAGPPLFYRPSFYVGTIAIVVGSLVIVYFLSNNHSVQDSVAHLSDTPAHQHAPTLETSQKTGFVSETGQELQEASQAKSLAEPDQRTEKTVPATEEKSQELSVHESPVIEELTEKTKENPGPVVDETRRMVEDENAFILLRVSRVSIMAKSDLASASGSSARNTDVTNPNIGGKTVTKTPTNDYSLDDMPYHEGGDQGLTSYVTRHLNNKIHIRKRDAVYSVNVSFEVSAKGTVGNVEVMDDIPTPMAETIRHVILNDQGWFAGKKSGKKGSLQVILNISFY